MSDFRWIFRCQLVRSVIWCSVVCVWGWQPTFSSSSLKQRTKPLWRSVRCSLQEMVVKLKTSRWDSLINSGSKKWMGMVHWCLEMWTKWTGPRNSGEERGKYCLYAVFWCYKPLFCALQECDVFLNYLVIRSTLKLAHSLLWRFYFQVFWSHTIVCVMNRLKIELMH